LRERAGAALPNGAADGFRLVVGGLRPEFGAGSEKASARLLLPERSTTAMHIEDAKSDTSVEVRLKDVRDVGAEAADGYVVYRNARAGATLLHRPSPDGVEDFVSFETRPASPQVAYDVAMGLGAAALRLIDGTLEVLDAKGAPRLRVSPPYLVGADGVRTDAKLSVAGCAFDDSPAPPWDHPVTAPGAKTCTVRVTWNDTAVAYPAILDPRWSSTASMGTARQEHVMVKLASGRVLVAGGRSSNTSTTALASAEVFDPTSATWSPAGSMAAARRVFGAVQLGSSTGSTTTSGKVLVVGGLGGTAGTTSLATAELFDPTAGTWTAAAALPSARHEGTTTLLASGQVLVAGGLSGTTVLNTAIRYNPASGTGSWTPVANMATARRSHTATLLVVPGNTTLHNKVLVVGGNSGTASLTSVQLFDGTSAWTTLTALSSPCEGQTATGLANGNVLITGGRNGTTTLNTAQLFTVFTGSGSWGSVASMSTARSAHTATLLSTNVVGPGQVLVAGGSSGTSALGSTEVWDGTNWSFVTALPSSATVQGHTATLLGSGRVLIAGGISGTTVQSAARLYDPSNGFICTSNSQCANGLCIDNVCCATTCTGACMACNVGGSLGTCAPKPAGTTCTTGNACTTGETCQAGAQAGTCGGGAPVTCPGADQCNNAGACNPTTGCQAPTPKQDGTNCSDGHACTVNDTCQTGKCLGAATNSCTAPVMDFDTLGKWSFTSNGTVVGLNSNHTQGTSSLEVKPHGYAPLVSTNQTDLGEVGTLALLDILLPTQQPNQFWYGAVQLYVSVPSLSIFNAYLGQVELTGLPLNKWQTIAFQLTPQLAAQLSGTYSDLTFTIALNVPDNQTASYLLDNLRFVSDVVPTLLGIATNSAGVTKAIFDYSTTNVTNVSIPYGPANALSNQSGFIAVPPEFPPQLFVAANHPPFLATLGPNQLTWTVAGHSVTATSQSTQLPTTTLPDGTRVATLPDGRKVNLDSVPPQDPGQAAEPALGARFFGTIPSKLDASPSGAAIYTVPIAIPPGIAGMAPNLSLVYNSQGGDGLAGQGWELSGLSMIHRCPKTRVQDGFARPVTMGSLEPPPPSQNAMDGTVDGICLDGKRLFLRSDGTYHLEGEDFSVITGHTDVGGSVAPRWFTVETKGGEKRYYGLNPKARVTFPRGQGQVQEIAIWALDRVIDAWGNYYDVHYNHDQADFTTSGLIVTQIDYTGKMGTNRLNGGVLEPAGQPFHSITFGYGDGRPDVRHTRFADVTIPKVKRLTSITTPLGTYSLTYLPDTDPMLPSRLSSIRYCAAGGATCLDDLVFDWEGGGYGWDEAPDAAAVGQANSYQMPAPIDTFRQCNADMDQCNIYMQGTQFIDLNGDGRLDFVQSVCQNDASGDPTDLQTSHAWINNGHGWTPNDSMALPAGLIDPSHHTIGTTFADIDGDGWVDLVAQGDGVCDPGGDGKCYRPPIVWYNRGTRWEPDSGLFGKPTSHQPATSTFPRDTWGVINLVGTDSLADMNGDGRADLVRVDYSNGRVMTLINTPGVGWVDAGNHYTAPGSIDNYNGWRPLRFTDVNRDGLTDITTNSGGIGWINQGPSGQFAFPASAKFTAPGNVNSAVGLRFTGDVDGDGLFDSVSVFNWGDLRDFGGPATNTAVYLSSGGFGFTTNGADAYVAPLVPFEPPHNKGYHVGANMADLNGDGLGDMVIRTFRGWQAPGEYYFGPGDVMINTGTTWAAAAVPQVPILPQEIHPPPYLNNLGDGIDKGNGAAFIDLNGDGVTDVIRAYSQLGGPRSWLNTFKRPVIKAFPNGIARKTQVTYAIITNADTQAQAIYQDSLFLTEGTTHVVSPLNVVASVKVDDGLETSSLAETKYAYSNLRGSATGRGPQGFSQVQAHDMRSDIITFTSYAQAYPYTGLPTSVLRATFGPFGTPIASTKTTYCDTVDDNGSGPLCSPMTGTTSDTIATSRFIYPVTVVDASLPPFSNRPPPLPPPVLTTETQLRYDHFGNLLKALVRTTSKAGEIYEKLTDNVYATQGTNTNSIPLRLGKLAQTTVTSQRLQPASTFDTLVRHVTAFDQTVVGQFSDSGDGGRVNSILALSKTRVEPGALEPVEIHTAYDYDGFGHVVVSKDCATDFSHCDVDPSHVGPASLPFRTTTTNYDPDEFTPPVGGRPFGLTLNYGRGRFPVKTTNAAGHIEYSAFDPITGALIQKTAPNGIATCYAIDPFGHQTSQTDRCGSDSPQTATTLQYRYVIFDLPLAKLVTVAKPANGDAIWTYTDAVGRKISVRRRGFDGRFTDTAISYNAIGKPETETKPHFIGEPVLGSTTTYDILTRVKTVTQALGVIRGSGSPSAATKLETTYDDLTNSLDETVGGVVRRRSETKNALGKVASVKDAGGETIQYAYDGDGNLRFVTDPAGNVVEIRYDARGRKERTIDPDMGTWRYEYNGFGDLVTQIDGKGQITRMSYDRLGRLTRKTELADTPQAGTAEWVYDVAPGGIGMLAAVVSAPDPGLAGPCSIPNTTLTDGNRAGRSLKYTKFGELTEMSECADGSTFVTSYTYDSLGRQSSIRYPAVNGKRLTVGYHYTSLGYLQYLTDDSQDYGVLWQETSANAFDQVVAETTRNGVETTMIRNPAIGWLMSTTSRAHLDGEKLIQNAGYTYDEAGNLLSRSRSDEVSPNPVIETFTNDALNRVKTSQVTIPLEGYNRSESFDYDRLGNLTLKDNKVYAYNAGCVADARAAGPHATCTVGGGAQFVYDGNGNMTSGSGRSVQYNSMNKPKRIQGSGGTVDFIYGAEGDRVVQETGAAAGRTVYVGLGARGHSLYERTTTSSGTQHVHYVYAGNLHGGNPFALRIVAPDGSTQATKYYAFDHLGSVTALSDESGRVATTGPDADVLGYDPWGARRNPNGTEPPPSTTFNLKTGRREFTGHETIPAVGLVNMNGRVYDPELGRFLSADPNVQFTANLQSYNRYSYVLNNPLRSTDPTGYFLDELTGIDGLDFTVGLGFAIGAVAVCGVTGGTGCVVAGVVIAIYQSFAMAVDGVPFGTILAVNAISITAGLVTAGLGAAAGGSFAAALVVGAVSSAGTAALTTYAMGGEITASNLLLAAAQGAVSAGFAWGLSPTRPVSQASADEAQKGGDSSDPRYMHRTAWFRDTATGTMQAIDPEGSMENFITTGESPLQPSDDGSSWHRLTHTFKEVVRSMEKIGVDLDAIRVNHTTGAAGQGGITFWNHVFLKQGMSNTDEAFLLTHEMVHSPQWSRLGPVVFLIRYGIEQLFLPNRGYGDPATLSGVPVESTNPVGRDYSLDGAADHVRCQFFPGKFGC